MNKIIIIVGLIIFIIVSVIFAYHVGQNNELKWQDQKNKNLIITIQKLKIQVLYRDQLLWKHGGDPREYQDH